MVKTKIAFFGASVTEQKNGYCTHFRKIMPDFEVVSYGYGATHISNAGICYIDNVLASKPEYCFIDWFSTAYPLNAKPKDYAKIIEYTNTIIYRFFSARVKVIFLILPRVNQNNALYNEIKKYLSENKIPFIDLSTSFKDLNLILRDPVHTTEQGSIEYSNLIKKQFMDNLFQKYQIPDNYPKKNKYCDIKKLNIFSVIYKKIVFDGNCEVIGISQNIGPFSGILKINETRVNNWDKHCYYERDIIKLDFKVAGLTTIEVLQDDFDKSECTHPANWAKEKYLNLKTVYYIGDNLKVVNWEEIAPKRKTFEKVFNLITSFLGSRNSLRK